MIIDGLIIINIPISIRDIKWIRKAARRSKIVLSPLAISTISEKDLKKIMAQNTAIKLINEADIGNGVSDDLVFNVAYKFFQDGNLKGLMNS